MILNCAIVDDEPLALGLLQSYVERTSCLRLVGAFSSAVQALERLTAGEEVDLLFLDIQMPGLSGLEFSKMVGADTRIVFTTAFGQYALDGYRVNALDYLLKPISYADFLQAVGKATEWHRLRRRAELPREAAEEFIYVRSDYKLVQVALADILYVEGLKDYVKIYRESDPHPLLSLVSLKAMEEKLPAGRFVRVHRSYIVQRSKIRVMERGRIVFGKERIPVSEACKDDLQRYLDQFSV